MSSEFVKIKFDKDNSNCLNLNRDYSDICAICRMYIKLDYCFYEISVTRCITISSLKSKSIDIHRNPFLRNNALIIP